MTVTAVTLVWRWDSAPFGDTTANEQTKVSKTVAGTSCQYVCDQDGHLPGENAADGGLITEATWLGDVPVAVRKLSHTDAAPPAGDCQRQQYRSLAPAGR